TRDSAMTLARNELGMEVIERSIRRSELYLADEVFLTGTAAHVTPVGTLDSRDIGNGGIGPITRKIRDMYLEAIRGDSEKYLDWCTEVPLK
ncbi:MAG: aminotransferase class IV, partial [Chloroflexi bacterium]|nr:aminotransferase class IV [Chloroflexota bacterium]